MGYVIHAEGAQARTAGAAQDARGLAIGTRSAESAARVEAALESLLSYFGDPLALFDEAIVADPGWAHAHTLKACALLTFGEHAPAQQAREILDAVDRMGQSPIERERAHVVAARSAAAGDWDRACELWDAILVQWPRDVAALLFAHLFDFYRGDALNLKRRPQRVLPHWSRQMPFYGYVLGMLAFGQEESGHYADAEDAGRAALAANPRDPWAVHAVTHVFEMEGRHRDGAAWLSSREPDWAVDNGFSYHNWFHAALFAMEDLDTAAALAIYDAQHAPATGMALQRVDGTGVLWRLKLLGLDVTQRFDALRRAWETRAPAAGFYAFNDLHALIAHIGAGDASDLRAARDALSAAMERPDGGATNQRMSAQVGLPLARAFMDYADGRWAAAAQGLLAVRDRSHGFGGSHAQRDILTLTLMDAAARAGQGALATHILNERVPAKATTPLTNFWRERIAAGT
jgi:tetratricopeptide (TPR) repeat protein